MSLKFEPQNCVIFLTRAETSIDIFSSLIPWARFIKHFVQFLSVSFGFFFPFELKIERSHQLLCLLQGNLLGGIDNKTLDKEFQVVYLCSFLSNTQFITGFVGFLYKIVFPKTLSMWPTLFSKNIFCFQVEKTAVKGTNFGIVPQIEPHPTS